MCANVLFFVLSKENRLLRLSASFAKLLLQEFIWADQMDQGKRAKTLYQNASLTPLNAENLKSFPETVPKNCEMGDRI